MIVPEIAAKYLTMKKGSKTYAESLWYEDSVPEEIIEQLQEEPNLLGQKEFLPAGQNTNGQFYAEELCCLRECDCQFWLEIAHN